MLACSLNPFILFPSPIPLALKPRPSYFQPSPSICDLNLNWDEDFMRPELSKDSWSNYRRALTKKDCEVFDEMANKARIHTQAIADASSIDPVEGILLSIMLENEKELRRLRTR